MKKINNEVIVIGADHYNALGVIRSLGESGINPIFILISSKRICMSSYSKYIKKLVRIKSDDCSDVLSVLRDNFNNLEYKPVIIPTGDPITSVLDKNYDELSKKFLIPNINDKENMIIKYMDKIYQEKLCRKYKINVAKSFFVNLQTNFNDISIFPTKVIIKPEVSAYGKKSDIIIANKKEKILDGLRKFKESGYSEVLVQEYLDYDMEYAMMGISYKGDVIIPGINSNNYIFPSNRGNTSFAEMFPVSDFEFDISKIKTMISEMNYTGLFEVETFKVGNKLYFNEMNFRNSANLYAYSGNNINYIYLYILLVTGNDISKEKIKVDKHYNFCIEFLHLGNVKENKIKLFKCFKNILNSTKLFYNKNDLKPFFMKIYSVIINRLFK